MTIGQVYLRICGLTKVHMEFWGNSKITAWNNVSSMSDYKNV